MKGRISPLLRRILKDPTGRKQFLRALRDKNARISIDNKTYRLLRKNDE